MNATFYSGFSKRINSTKQPSGGTSVDVRLKEQTSIDRPEFLLQGSLPNYDYCYFDGRYYFVDDITSVANNLYLISCSLDHLATYKSYIGSYTCFVERASSQRDIYIVDNAISAEQQIVYADINTSELVNFDASGCYVVRVVGKNASEGGVSNYVLTQAELQTLLTYSFNSANFPTEIEDDVIKTFFNPFQYIISIMWFPISKNTVVGGGGASSISLGWWTVAGSFSKLGSSGYTDVHQIALPTNYYNDFRAYDPRFTQITLHIPGTGALDLDPTLFSGNRHIVCETTVDYLTGNANTTIGLWSGGTRQGTVATVQGQWGVPVTVGQLSGITDSITTVVSGIASGVAGNVAGAVSGAIEGAKNILSPTPSVLGGAGNRSQITTKKAYSLSIRNYGSGEIPNTQYGRPLCKNVTLSSLSGFIKCAGASVDIPSLGKEKEIVNSYLNSGFYYE